MKAKRSIQSIIDAPSRFEGDAYHHYRQSPDSTLGEADPLIDQVDAFCRAMFDATPTAAEAASALAALFSMAEDKKKKGRKHENRPKR